MASQKVITREMLVSAVELIETGATHRDAARKSGFTYTTLRKYLEDHPDLKQRAADARSRLNWTDDQFAEAVRLAGLGMDDRVVAQNIGLSEYAMRDARARSDRLRQAMDAARSAHRAGLVPGPRDGEPAGAPDVAGSAATAGRSVA